MNKLDKLLAEWSSLSEQLSIMKTRENNMRLEIVQMVFGEGGEGYKTHPLQNGYKLRANLRINRTINKDSLTELNNIFEEEGLAPDLIIKYKPELSMAGYNACSIRQRSRIDTCLTVRPGAPTLEIISPKKGGAQ